MQSLPGSGVYGGAQQVLCTPRKVQERIRDFIQSWHPLTSRGEYMEAKLGLSASITPQGSPKTPSS